MTVDAIITLALKAIDGILDLVASLGSQLSQEDLAKLKLGVLNGINERATTISQQEAAEWAIVGRD